MRRLCAALLGGLGLATGAAALEPGWHERSIEFAGQARWVRVYRPAAAHEGAPAVLLLHGGTQSMRKMFREAAGGTRAWLDIAEREGVTLIVPNGTKGADAAGDNQHWNDLRQTPHASGADDVAFLNTLVGELTRELRLDPQRLYVSGASNGGMMSYRLLIEAPQRFAAAAAFIANLPEGAHRLAPPSRPTPLMILNGTLDGLVPWDGGTVAREHGTVVSTDATVAWWIGANRAHRAPSRTETLPDLDPRDGCRLQLEVHDAGPGGAPVWFYRAVGGGHAMPSVQHRIADTPFVRRLIGPVCRDAEGAELAWRFFESMRPPR